MKPKIYEIIKRNKWKICLLKVVHGETSIAEKKGIKGVWSCWSVGRPKPQQTLGGRTQISCTGHNVSHRINPFNCGGPPEWSQTTLISG